MWDGWARCLDRCRTMSHALLHMNAYKSRLHFCFSDPPPPPPLQPRIARRAESCRAACSRHGLQCEFSYFDKVNQCVALRKHFRCGSCEPSMGFDQPAWVPPPGASIGDTTQPGRCLYNSVKTYLTCDGKNARTLRLCPCRKRDE